MDEIRAIFNLHTIVTVKYILDSRLSNCFFQQIDFIPEGNAVL